VLEQQVTDLERLEDGTMIVTSHTGERHHTRTLILALGYSVSKPAKLELEGADRYEVTNLHYTVTSLESFRGKRVLLSGGSDTAVDWAMELESIAAGITMVHRRDRLVGHEKNVRHIMESSIRVAAPYVIAQLHGNGNVIEAVTIARVNAEGGLTEETERVEVDAVIINHGHPGDFGPIVNWGLEMDLTIRVNDRLATNLPGIFAAGDTTNYAGKLRLIAGAFNDAAVAVNGAKLYLDPTAPSMAYVSSHNGKFNELNKALLSPAKE
jgi:thioredoxin reductase (NADPH)